MGRLKPRPPPFHSFPTKAINAPSPSSRQNPHSKHFTPGGDIKGEALALQTQPTNDVSAVTHRTSDLNLFASGRGRFGNSRGRKLGDSMRLSVCKLDLRISDA